MEKEVEIKVCYFCGAPDPCLYHPLSECKIPAKSESKVSKAKSKKK